MTIRPPAAYCRKEEIGAGGRKKFASELAYCWRQHSEVSMMMAEAPISRPTPPRPEDYVVVPGSQGPRRDFRISIGLREGWDAEGRVFDVSEAVRTARAWMKRRVESGQPALSGMFSRAEVTYAWPRDDGTVGSDREPWPYSRAKRSTRTSVISPMRPSRSC